MVCLKHTCQRCLSSKTSDCISLLHHAVNLHLCQLRVSIMDCKCLLFSGCTLHSRCIDDGCQEGSGRTTIRAENEVEAHKEANNYRVSGRDSGASLRPLVPSSTQDHSTLNTFMCSAVEHAILLHTVLCTALQADGAMFFSLQFGFRKWKSHVTERPIEDRSEVVRELYSELNFIRPVTG